MVTSHRRSQLATPEKRLFFELEDSVTTNLLLNERLLASQEDQNLFYNDESKEPTFHTLEPITSKPNQNPLLNTRERISLEANALDLNGETDDDVKLPSVDEDEDKDTSFSSQSVSPLRPKALASLESLSCVNLSLLDSEPDIQNKDILDDDSVPSTSLHEGAGPKSSHCSSTRLSLSSTHGQTHFIVSSQLDVPRDRSDDTLDDLATSTASTMLCDVSSTQSSIVSARSLVTSNGEATTKLVCPFVDVADTRIEEQKRDLGQIYHLTFYGSKIGIQFQKVPAESFNNGKLADAMTSDLFEGDRDYAGERRKTHTDLEKIKNISMWNSTNNFDVHHGDTSSCPVAFPKDIVLVCGFHGFDDLSNNKRPLLGARLIAFDGISVEVGPWYDLFVNFEKICFV
jgi:hypothetical protein